MKMPTKKLVPAHIVPATSAVADVKTIPSDKIAASSAASTDSVVSSAVAAVVATQTYMKVLLMFHSFCFINVQISVAIPQCETLSLWSVK